ncbi:hypothetical protein [Dyadobacter pollutisoli]|jgi:hypothetical protein|uniref:Uncharacterized protein n=1 Tax=Dyadobacter pollutisoli TaxID=2910158 RepID=A0A9E8SP17_9BACT|nr:hypothetical protein [Dyadobacter pollutisoli]WAC11387.1 hypothetical protein ON006_27100 [Dyadobacter pollutisoli]
MNLVQKLPIGLSLVCVMFVSSCSKEDIQTIQPQTGSIITSSNLKEQGGVLSGLLDFPATNGQPGINTFPPDWARLVIKLPDNSKAFPTGTSTLTHLWGKELVPWVKPLPKILGVRDMFSIVTVATNHHLTSNISNDYSRVKTKIKQLKKGKEYAITFYVASTIRNVPGFVPAYAERAVLQIGYANSVMHYYINMAGKEAQWIANTITFEAHDTEAIFTFSADTAQPGQYSYAHIFVDKDSIKELN